MSLGEMLKRAIARRIYKFIKYWAVDIDSGVDLTNESYRKAGMRIGTNVAIYSSDLDFLYPELITIGDNVTITHATILAHDDSPVIWLKRRRIAPVVIGSNVFVGHHSLILPGVKIGSDCIIGAGSIVTKDVPDNCIVAGNPARIIKTLADYQNKIRYDQTLINLEVSSNIVTSAEELGLKDHALGIYRQDLLP